MSAKQRILNILFWSVISAAFIGPGTITTAANSGTAYGTGLLWALTFSTLACLLMQEAAARLTIVSGKNLGQAISEKFEDSKLKRLIQVLVLGAIVLGAAAYEMGNLLGAAAGLKLLFEIPQFVLILIISVFAVLILNIPSLKIISTIMGFAVVVMGIGFMITAFLIHPSFKDILKNSVLPAFPTSKQEGILVLGLIGTTIVPYNLFLGSGISAGNQSVKEMRFGLTVAILLGGLFSMAVLVAGTAITSEFSFEKLALALNEKIGPSGKYLLGFGLFAAGFTSSVTAPLAAAITLKSLFGNRNPEKWSPSTINFKSGWIFTLLAGLGFALVNIKPIPAIILAQALNGFLLPFVGIFLFIIFNKYRVKGANNSKSVLHNLLMMLVIFTVLVLGLNSAVNALLSVFHPEFLSGNNLIIAVSVVSALISLLVWIKANPGKQD